MLKEGLEKSELCCERRRRVKEAGKEHGDGAKCGWAFPSLSRGYNGSFPQGAKCIQTRSDRKTTPSQPLLHSCFHLHPLLCGHAPALSPASSLVIFTVSPPRSRSSEHVRMFGGTRWTGIPNPSAGDRRGCWLSPLRVRGRGDAGALGFPLV